MNGPCYRLLTSRFCVTLTDVKVRLNRFLRTSALVMATLMLLLLAACDRRAEPVSTPSPTLGTIVPTPAILPGATPPQKAPTGPPLPLSTEEPETGAMPGHCDELCSEEFWQGDVTVVSVQAQLERGADVNAQDSSGIAPLRLAIYYGAAPEIIRLLLDDGADAAEKDDYGTPILVEALAYSHSPEIIRLLLEFGADANAKDEYGSLPLHLAASYGRSSEIIELLLKHGADATTRDDFGQSVLFIYLATLIESESGEPDPEVVQLLLEHGADVTLESDGWLVGDNPRCDVGRGQLRGHQAPAGTWRRCHA